MEGRSDVLVHLVSQHDWRAAMALGAVTPPSLVEHGFVHLSAPAQVPIPADALFRGRTDMLALVVDPGRLDDVVGRVRRSSHDSLLRRAPVVRDVVGGVAVVDPRLPDSHESNAVCLLEDRPGDEIVDVCEEMLGRAGVRDHRVVLELDDAVLPDDLTSRGWDHERLSTMVDEGPPVEPDERVVELARDQLERWWASRWREDLTGVDDEVVRQLVVRERLVDLADATTDLGVVIDGEVVASAQLRIDGATAEITAVMTSPAHRDQGRGTAVVRTALVRAAADDVDLVWLDADAEDWPRQWYARLGFREVARRHELGRASE